MKNQIHQQQRIIDLTDALPDITSNLVVDSQHYNLPPSLFEDLMFEALNDLVDKFALNPNHYLEPKHYEKMTAIAAEYLNS